MAYVIAQGLERGDGVGVDFREELGPAQSPGCVLDLSFVISEVSSLAVSFVLSFLRIEADTLQWPLLHRPGKPPAFEVDAR